MRKLQFDTINLPILDTELPKLMKRKDDIYNAIVDLQLDLVYFGRCYLLQLDNESKGAH